MTDRAGLSTLIRRVNLRHVRDKKLRTTLTVAGIAAGVALMFSISVVNATLLSSFRSSIRDLAGAAELEVAAADTSGLPATLVRSLRNAEGVSQAVPVLRSTTELQTIDGRRKRILVLGITPGFVSLFPRDTGRLARFELSGGFGPDGKGLVVPSALGDELGLSEGAPVTVQAPSGRAPVAVTGEVRGGSTGVLNGGDVAFMLLPAAQETFEKQERVDSIYIVADPAVPPAETRDGIEDLVGGAGVVGAPGERGEGLERVFSSLGTLLSMGGTVALFVALFVVYNTMSMSLAERRREISMVIALGAGRREVFAAFLGEAAILGAFASAAGLGAGWWLAGELVARAADDFQILSINSSGPVVVRASAVALAAIGGLGVSVLGAYLPARRVLKVAPVESLRPVAAYEWDPGSSRFDSAKTIAAGVVAVLLSALMLPAFLLYPDERWIVTVGLLFGLSGVTLLLPQIVPRAMRVLRPVMRRLFGTTGRLSYDALARNPGRSTFTVAALVLTLGLVVGVSGALASYESQIERTATALIGAPIYVTSETFTGLTSDQPLELELGEDLAAAEGVRFVYPLRFAFLDLGGEQALVYALPVEGALEQGATSELGAITPDPDRFLEGLADGGVAASRLAAKRLDLEVGDSIDLPTPRGARSFQVEALFDDLLSFNSFYLDLPTYQRLWEDDKADEFGILLERGASVTAVKARLQAKISADGAPAEVFEKDELVGRILEVVRGTFELAKGVQLAALVVAALTIANTMFTAVLERRWEMGLERAIGMGGGQLGRTVLLEAAAIGLVGGVGGVVLGMITAFFMTQAMEAEFSWRIPYQLPVVLMVMSVLGSVVLSALAGFLPSRMAIRTPIIESLRYE